MFIESLLSTPQHLTQPISKVSHTLSTPTSLLWTMAPIIKVAYYKSNFCLESNFEYQHKYRRQASLTEKLLQRTYFHEELHEVLKICLCNFEAKIGLLETLLSDGVMAYGKLIDPEYKYGDEGYDDAEVCFVSVFMLEEALEESKGVRANFDSSEIWNEVRRKSF